MDQDRLQYLLDRHRQHQCSPSEEEELNDWFHANNPGRGHIDHWLEESGGKEKLTADLYADFSNRIPTPSRVRSMTWMYRVAAASVILAVLAFFLYPKLKDGKPDRLSKTEQGVIPSNNNAIKPGGNKAVLKLANGQEIVLTDSVNVHIAMQSNTEVKQVRGGSIAYNTTNDQATDKTPVYNTLTTPRGGKYTLTLSDGTTVTLDAASSITYPVAFTGKERRVEITGQAYFEVVHNEAQPFRVFAKGQLVEDLGTAFNVNAYNDDPFIKVTLTEGKAAIQNAGKRVVLAPGQQAMVKDGEESILVKQVNVEETVAWKNGWFVFHHESIQNVMKLAARWYDIEVAYEGGTINKQFGGNISRYRDIAELLQNLKLTGGIKYRIEGRKVILMN